MSDHRITIYEYKMVIKVMNQTMVADTSPQSKKLPTWFQRKIIAFTYHWKEPTIVPVFFFKLAYYLLCSPFYFKKSGNGRFLLQKWLPQEILWWVAVLASLAVRVSETRASWPDLENQLNPSTYFAAFYNILNVWYNIIVSYTLHRKQKKFLDMVNFLHLERENVGSGKQRARAAFCSICVQVVATIIVLPCFILGTDIFRKTIWKPKLLLKCLDLQGRHLFFLTNDSRCHSDGLEGELSAVEIMMGCIYATTYFFRKVVGFYENLITSVGSVVLWICTNEFIVSLTTKKGSCPDKWVVISRRYNHLKNVTDLVNDIYGPLFLAHFLTACFFYSSNLEKVLGSGDLLERLKLLSYYVVFVLTVLVASDVCRQMSKLDPWIAKNLNEEALNDLSQKELTILLHEMQTNRISISGCGAFTLTYSLSAQVTGVIITYFIIALQYRLPPLVVD